ncbi:hypothetical protein B0T26DRAFT_804109 [Lasiosphaeria miniovina]|uniref:Uncharacterized protein n=1 Tax=Lasiosphaeria miniovina TaxID=1954250 RepID=A0AA40ACA6_9PEZI|nr:uncharacterized protein B0T26DRAFT_804109 [Lasiosphaeria miniovina]KAK0713249.1 hypothetical protein B0T26DRAFT_804109 [Lasiosphaeria miniovina]
MGSVCSVQDVKGEIAEEQKSRGEREAREAKDKEGGKLGKVAPPTRQVPPRDDDEINVKATRPLEDRNPRSQFKAVPEKEDLKLGAGGPPRVKAPLLSDEQDGEELTASAPPLLHIGAVVLETWIRLDEQLPTVDKPSGLLKLEQRPETASRDQRQNPPQPRNPRTENDERVPESFETFVQALYSKAKPLTPPSVQGASVPVSKWSIHPALPASLTKSKPYIMKLVSPVFRWLPAEIVSVEVVGTKSPPKPNEKAAKSAEADVPADPKEVDATVSNMFGFLSNNYAMIKDPNDDYFDTRVLLSVVGDLSLSHVKVFAQAIVYFELALEAALTKGTDTKTGPLSQSGYEIWLTAPSKSKAPKTLDTFMALIKNCPSLSQLIDLMNPHPPALPQGVQAPPRYFRWDLQRLRIRDPSDPSDLSDPRDSEPSVIVFHLGNSCTSSDDLLRILDFAATFVPSALFVLGLTDLRREYSNNVDGLNRFMRDSFVKQRDIRPLNSNTLNLLNSRVEVTLPTGRAGKSDDIKPVKQRPALEYNYGDPALDKLRRCRARLA